MRRPLFIILLICSLSLALVAKNRKEVPLAPLPSPILEAKKVFLTNGGGSNLAYDAFYSAMKNWRKYEIVGSPDAADVVIELAYRVEDHGTRVFSTTNTYTGQTDVHSRELIDPQLVLTIYDGKTRQSLWSTTDHRRLARREKNREKETINSAERLVEMLKGRVDTAPAQTETKP
jgi:hypothetical protein